MSGAASGVAETIEAKLKDQYTEDMAIKTATVTNLAKPDGATAPALTASLSGKKATVTVDAAAFATAAGKTGTYTYKISLKDNDNKEIVRTFTINVVDKAAVQAYQLAMPTEIDTTVKADTADATGFVVTAKVIETANGATISDYTADGTNAKNVEYTVKDKDGKDVSSDFVRNDSNVLSVKTVSAAGTKFQKNLAAGTYYVTAKFQVKTKKADGTYEGDLRDVAVSGSFTVKDSQDTAAQINVKKNDLDGQSVTAALQSKTYMEVTYDGVSQTLTGDVHKINGTIAGNTAYVTSVEVFVQLTNTNASGTHNKVLITIPVNQTFTNVNGSL